MSSNRTFQYQPLSLYRPQIRLLKISLDPSDSSIHCHLHHFDFNRKPPYYALSYTWGPNHDPKTISVNSQTFKVSPNIFCFLALARDGGIDPNTYLWIDQICIDQSDDAFTERADQVGRMGKIYADAVQVVVWLGFGDPHVELFLDLVENRETIRVLNDKHTRAYDAFYQLSQDEMGQRENFYKKSAPRKNPASRSNETLTRRILLRVQDAKDLFQNHEVSPLIQAFGSGLSI